MLVDESYKAIILCLWGEQATISDYSNHPVLACKSVRVQEYNNGRTLNSHENMVMELDPQIPRADQL